jgi:Type II/IV secretion system protein
MTLRDQPPHHPDPVAPRAGRPPRSRIGEVPAGLAQLVQRRLAANGAVASDAASLRAAVAGALGEDGAQLPAANLNALVRAIGDELTGLGPLAPLLADPAVTDVLVNGPAEVWVERGGAIERAAVRFPSAAAVAALVQRVVAPLGLRVDESRPWVDARLPGGERFHAVLPPLAPDGPVVTIRAFARRRLRLCDLIERDALDTATARLLEAMVAAGVAIAVSGATGTGKTTLLNTSERHLLRDDDDAFAPRLSPLRMVKSPCRHRAPTGSAGQYAHLALEFHKEQTGRVSAPSPTEPILSTVNHPRAAPRSFLTPPPSSSYLVPTRSSSYLVPTRRLGCS